MIAEQKDSLFGIPVGRLPVILFLLALCTRLIAWPFSDVVDADAVTRALLGESYMLYPGWRGDGVWPPLHFYLNGLFTVLCGSRVIGSVLVNILLGSAIVFPVFSFVRRWSGSAVASAVTLIVVFNPLVFRNSLQGLAEVPFFFFSACAFNAVSIAQSDPSSKGTKQAMLGGLFITLASGMRYEAWLFIILLAALLLIARQWQRLMYFTMLAMVFPVAWMITNQLAHGNMFQGAEQIIHWYGNAADANVPANEMLLRTAFFPVSFLLAISPLVVLLGLVGAAVALLRGALPDSRWPWLLFFPLFVIIMISKARHAELLLQHRFTMTLILLFIPYLALGLALLRSKVLILSLSVLSASWGFYSSINAHEYSWLRFGTQASPVGAATDFILQNTLHEMEAIPVMDHQLPEALLQRIDAIKMDRELLVLDFFGWQETYNVAFRAEIRATSIVFLPTPDVSVEKGTEHLEDYLNKLSKPHGLMVLVEGGAYQAELGSASGGTSALKLPTKKLLLTPVGKVEDLLLYTFSVSEK